MPLLNPAPKTAAPPGPRFTEVLGQLPLIFGDRLAWMSEIHRRHGDIVRIPLGPRNVYAAFHPDYIRQVLAGNAKNYWKGRTFEKTAGYLGKGLATSEGTAWQTQRRRMNPQFHREALKGLTGTMVFTIEKMLSRWSLAAQSGELIDLSLEFQRMAMEVVARSLFGIDVPEDRIGDIIAAFKVALKFTTRRTLNPFDIPERLPLPGNMRFKKAIALVDEVVYDIIRAENERSEPSGNLLSMLIRAEDPETGSRMPEKQLRDEVMTLFLGGTDTSGNTLSWVMYNLARYPEVKRRLRTEVAEVLGGRKPEADHIEKLAYTKRVVEETLRLFPQNWVMSRDSLERDVIGGVEIPAGSTVFLGVYIAHRRADFWTNPESFDPDRFTPENSAGRHPMAYLPFGGGPRKCIGFQFAMMEFALALSMIHQRFDVELIDADKITSSATWSLWPTPGVLARLTER